MLKEARNYWHMASKAESGKGPLLGSLREHSPNEPFYEEVAAAALSIQCNMMAQEQSQNPKDSGVEGVEGSHKPSPCGWISTMFSEFLLVYM